MTYRGIKILYEDNHLLIVEKPPNIPVQADSSGDPDLLSMLKSYIGEKYDKPGAVYLGLVHRLDRPVGGIMVFARTSKAAARLSAQFRSGALHKRYIAVVEGSSNEDGFCEDYIMDGGGGPRVRVSPFQEEGAKKAMLRYHRIACQSDSSLLDIELLTGRKHQIRAQLAAHGYPIMFDQRYHPNPARGQIALFAYALTLIHPTRQEEMTFCSVPSVEAFEAYENTVMALGAFKSGYALYADGELLIVDKQTGVEVTRKDGGDTSLQAAMEECFGALYPVHRIDANTRGLVVFARGERAQSELEDMFLDGGIEKTYRALVSGTPSPDEAILTAYAVKDASNARLKVRSEAFSGAVRIKTGYRVIDRRGDNSLLEIRLYTGKTHQIRAHMAHIGHPVLGDDKYGDRDINKRMRLKAQALTAYALSFTWHGKRMEFKSSFGGL